MNVKQHPINEQESLLVTKCNHKWTQYGYSKRTDKIGQTTLFYECVKGCGQLKQEVVNK